MINSMSPEQWREVPKIRQEIIDLESQPIDENKVRYWIGELYKSIGEKAPQVLFFDSPLAMQLAAASVNVELGDELWGKLGDQLWGKLGDQLGDQLWGKLGDQLGGQLMGQLWNQLMGQLGDELRNQLGDQLGGQLWDQLWDQLGDQLGDQLRGELWNQLGGQLGDQLGGQIGGQWLSSYLAWFKGAKLAGVKFDSQAWELYRGYVENVSSILPYQNVVFATRKPIEIHWQDGLLHNESGPAVLYADGWRIYSIEGVRVDQQIVEKPETQSLEQINNEENEEKKRIRISRYGWHRYLEEMEAKPIDVATGQWMESLMQCGDMKILCTYDPSTGRPYALEVDPECQTCEQAQRYLLAPEVALQGLGIAIDEVETYPILRT